MTASPATKCTLPTYPAPVDVATLGIICQWEAKNYVCLTPKEAVNLGVYIRDAERYRDAAEVCRGK